MNVYDFDKTVFYPDSSACFLKFCLRHYPKAFRNEIGTIVSEFFRYAFTGDAGAEGIKEALFSVLKYLPDVNRTVNDFWDENFCRIQQWYLEKKREDDVIISASPDFLVRPAAEKLGVQLIATPMCAQTGKIAGSNCHDEEKVRRFREIFPDGRIDAFYSDSLSDEPLAKLAEEAYLVKKGRLIPWP